VCAPHPLTFILKLICTIARVICTIARNKR
jgi:hypothetical protein